MFDWQQEAELQASRFGLERMRGAMEALSEAYRAQKTTLAPRIDEELLVATYLAVRFPATRAAARAAAMAVAERIENFAPTSVLDLGAGCGAASLALGEVWPTIDTVSAVEQIVGMVELGKRMQPNAIWRTTRLEDQREFAGHDVVVVNYALAEARGDSALVEKAWKAADKLLLIVEAGTPKGFEVVHEAREKLIALGATIAAPCPSNAACPARGEDWCHFAARLNRSALHRRLKGGTLSYEDEKFAYVAAWRGELGPGHPRVIRHPLVEPGRITMELCEAPARRKMVATKKSKPEFRRARKISWGDALLPIVED